MIRIQIQCIWIHNTGIESEFIYIVEKFKIFLRCCGCEQWARTATSRAGVGSRTICSSSTASSSCRAPLPTSPSTSSTRDTQQQHQQPLFYNFAKTCANVVQCWGAKITRIFFRLRLHFSFLFWLRLHFSFLFWLRLHFSFLFWLPLQQSNSSSTGILPL